MKPVRVKVSGFRGLFSMILDTWDEVDQRKDFGMSLSPDWLRYSLLEEEGGFFGYSLGNNGYAVFIVTEDLHRKGKKIATSSVIYLDKEERGRFKEYLPYIEKDLKEVGVDMISIIVKARESSTLYGYDLYEEVYQRAL